MPTADRGRRPRKPVEDMRIQVEDRRLRDGACRSAVSRRHGEVEGRTSGIGSALFMNKPGWGTGQLFFAKRAGTPILRRTTTVGRIARLPDRQGPDVLRFEQGRRPAEEHAQQRATFPTMRAAHRDLSQSNLTIYVPLTTRPSPSGPASSRSFPGNVIPPIASIRSPAPCCADADADVRPLFNGSAISEDGPQDQETLKVDHRWGPKWMTTGMYGHQQTSSPARRSGARTGRIPATQAPPTRSARFHFFSSNRDHRAEQHNPLAVRYRRSQLPGCWRQFRWRLRCVQPWLSGQLYQCPECRRDPTVTMNGYSNIGHGGRNPTLFEGTPVEATLTKFMGKHSMKFGVDDRRLIGTAEPPHGSFGFTQGHTGAEPQHGEKRRG